MPNWSINLFRARLSSLFHGTLGASLPLFAIRGIPLSLHLSFFLLAAYVAHEGWQIDRLSGATWYLATFIACFTCVVLHELGHCFTARRFGVGVRRILLLPIGGMAEFESIPRRPAHELLITLAGPAVNFALAALLWVFVPAPDFGDDAVLLIPSEATSLIAFLFYWNLAMGLFNLVPVFPMDGGRIFRALLATRLTYLRATFWAATLAKVLATLGIIVALAAKPLHLADEPLHLTAALFTFIFFVGELEYRAVKRRDAPGVPSEN